MNKLDKFTKEEFTLLYHSMSQKRLARTTGVTVNTVMKKVKELELPRKPKGRPKNTGYLFKDEQVIKPEVQEILDREKLVLV